MRLSVTILSLTFACQAQEDGGLGPSGASSNDTDTDPAESTNCPNGMMEIAPDGFTAAVGETSASTVDDYIGNIIPVLTLQAEPFCMATFPLPGSRRDGWLTDGLNVGQAEVLDGLLPDYGRRLCTVSELLIAAAGPANQPYPYGFEYQQGVCDTEAFTPSGLGSYEGCESPYGVFDFMVRSSWAVLDDDIRDVVEPGRGEDGFPGDGVYAVYGGTAQRDTFFSPNNYGIHFYGPGDYNADTPAYVTDDVRVCADHGALDAETETAWADWVADLSAGGTYTAVLGPGLDFSR